MKWRKSPSASAVAAATTAGIVLHALVVENVDALPSFGTKVPNGERVPCPKPSIAENGEHDPRTTGCTSNGFCFGLGHLQCGGFNPNAAIPVDGTDETETEQNISQLNVFGEDWKLNRFVWTKELCELDSDGDGFTNGEELGDPCCVWSTDIGTKHDIHPLLLNNKPGFVPSHPGLEDQVPEGLWDDMEDRATFCSSYNEDEATAEEDGANNSTAVEDEIPPILENTDNDYERYFNEGEPRESFEFRIKSYPIQVRTTDYADFVFNIPDNLPDVVHVVHAETLVSQPEHLHHFVLTGCTTRFDPEVEGVDHDVSPADCNVALGGWAPGRDVFGTQSFDTGVALGPGVGIVALHLNVHYTDGAYADPETKTQKIATDGMRLFYTTQLRPYTTLPKSLIWIPWGPMTVPANKSRYFLSRTCKVATSCEDSSPEQLQMIARAMGLDEMEGDTDNSMIDSLTCPMTFPFCFGSSTLAPYVQRLCPVTCGLCEGEDNPRNPDHYRVTSITYHAHLLGSEMYATLLREDESGGTPENLDELQKQPQVPPLVEARMIAKDLKSREIWHFDDQAAIPMDYDIVVADDEEETTASGASGLVEGTTITTAAKKLQRGVEVKAGDKIQVTCVYDSTARTEDTAFGISTYDEMCLINVQISFPTPESLKNTGELGDSLDSKISELVDMSLRSFRCQEENTESFSSDVYQGFLAENQDGRNIWYEHPIEDSEMCTYPVRDFVFGESVLTMETRNCTGGSANESSDYDPSNGSVDDEEGPQLCKGFSATDGDNDGGDTTNDPEVKLSEDAIAGYTCIGGAFDGQDGNKKFDDVSREKCLQRGGTSYEPYTCSDAQWWMRNEVPDGSGSYEILDYVRTVWQPMCCSLVAGDDANIEESEDEEETTSELWSSGAYSAQGGDMLKFLFTVALSTTLAMAF